MTLPHFLLLILAVIALAGATLWLVFQMGAGFGVVAFVALVLAGALRTLAWT